MKKISLASVSAAATSVGLALTHAAPKAFAQGTLSDVDVAAPRGFALSFGGLINGVLSFVLVIGALLVFFYLILGGIEWITSGGDKAKTEGARNKITSAIIGLIILAASYAVLQLALSFLGFNGLNDVFDSSGTIQGGAQSNN